MSDPDLNGDQFQLFTPSEPEAKLPGDLSYDEWQQRPDVSFHGTGVLPSYKPMYQGGQTLIHSGTRKSAEEYIHMKFSSTSGISTAPIRHVPVVHTPDVSEDEMGWDPDATGYIASANSGAMQQEMSDPNVELEKYTHYPDKVVAEVGLPYRVHGIRRHEDDTELGGHLNDFSANTAHVLHQTGYGGRGYVARSVSQGLGLHTGDIHAVYPESDDAVEALNAGQSISYENVYEHRGSTSYISPRSGVSTWQEDVAEESNQPPHVKEFYADRVRRGLEGPTTSTSYGKPPEQLQLFHG